MLQSGRERVSLPPPLFSVGWKRPTHTRGTACFTQLADSRASPSQKHPPRHPEKMLPGIWAPCGPVKLTCTMTLHGHRGGWGGAGAGGVSDPRSLTREAEVVVPARGAAGSSEWRVDLKPVGVSRASASSRGCGRTASTRPSFRGRLVHLVPLRRADDRLPGLWNLSERCWPPALQLVTAQECVWDE